MNFIINYFNRKFQREYITTIAIYGSCHSKAKYRSKWNPLRFILGDLKIKIIHPLDVLCKCDWTECGPRTQKATGVKK
jgi:hypothetical protein